MEAIFIPQNIFKVAGKGLVVSGSLKSGVLKAGMVAEIKKQKIPLIAIEAINKGAEEIKEGDQLGIVLPETALKLLSNAKEIIFTESK
jgi:translation elongation factor EF-Tu-like GTPase